MTTKLYSDCADSAPQNNSISASEFSFKPVKESEYDSLLVEEISKYCDVSPLLAKLLVLRGCKSSEDASIFLSPSVGRDFADPRAIPGMSQACDQVFSAIVNNKKILIFGDFDVDGITATCVLVRAFREFGCDPLYMLPNRNVEGYGLSDIAVEKILELNPDIVITVDCGISCAKQIDVLLEHGIEVCVTDHHEADEDYPKNVVVANPKLDKNCPSFNLAGVSVALKLVILLGEKFNKPDLARNYVDFAALGTVADLMPIDRENRSIITAGLDLMKNHTKPCFEAMINSLSLNKNQLSSTFLSFNVIPKLNAPGRIDSPYRSLDLLLCNDYKQSCQLAKSLIELNDKRRSVEQELCDEVENEIKSQACDDQVILVAKEGWNDGVKGIVAARIARKYKRPTLIFSIHDDIARGSGRSYADFNLYNLFDKFRDLYMEFGGHSGAIGITIKVDLLKDLRKRVVQYVKENNIEFGDSAELLVDAKCNLTECNIDVFKEILKLEPFGQQNKLPLLYLKNVFLKKKKIVGKSSNHLSFDATDGKNSIHGIYFGVKNIDDANDLNYACDIVFEPQIDSFFGREIPCLNAKYIISSKEQFEQISLDSKLNSEYIDTLMSTHNKSLYDLSNKDFAFSNIKIISRHDVQMDNPTKPSLEKSTDFTVSELEEKKKFWKTKKKSQLLDALRVELIGDNPLHEAQQRTINNLQQNISTLAIMPTGRGKSLIFHIHAAYMAIANDALSIFVYPLRALVADQAFHLKKTYAKFGLNIEVLTGQVPMDSREAIYEKIRTKQIDVVLTTPEFLTL
ncbi:MAG: single-stranded-DNA-specific exonuclease RecJ, partial [Coriobacteriales bacterium]|nr:single-stranded-DNA-specific exonuclease RecJ [Coriobacteriales bacterium]